MHDQRPGFPVALRMEMLPPLPQSGTIRTLVPKGR